MVPEMVADVICATARNGVVARRTTARITLNLMTTSPFKSRTEPHDLCLLRLCVPVIARYVHLEQIRRHALAVWEEHDSQSKETGESGIRLRRELHLSPVAQFREQRAVRDCYLNRSRVRWGSPEVLLDVRTRVSGENVGSNLDGGVLLVRRLACPMFEALLVVLVAHRLNQLRIRMQLRADGNLDRPRVHGRISERDFNIHVAEVAPAVALGHAQRFRVGIAG